MQVAQSSVVHKRCGAGAVVCCGDAFTEAQRPNALSMTVQRRLDAVLGRW